MYESYWGISASPFASGSNKGIFAETAPHQEVLARLQFLIEYQRRIGLFSGPEGVGKSTILQQLHRKYKRSQRQVAFVDLSRMNSHELLWHLVAALHLGPSDADAPLRLWRILEDYLNGLRYSRQQMVFFFDHFDPEQIDVLRVVERLQHLKSALTGWTTTIIAVSHSHSFPEMNSLIEMTELRIELKALDQQQTAGYVRELLRKAGAQKEVFEEEALVAVYQCSRGIPREIDRICDFAMLVAMQEQHLTVNAEIVLAVAEELQKTFPAQQSEADSPFQLSGEVLR